MAVSENSGNPAKIYGWEGENVRLRRSGGTTKAKSLRIVRTSRYSVCRRRTSCRRAFTDAAYSVGVISVSFLKWREK